MSANTAAKAGPGRATTKTQHLQNQVDDVMGIMQDNVTNVMQRGEKLSSMKNKAADLEKGANAFGRSATRVKEKAWFEDMKMKLILIVVVLIILGIVLVPMFIKKKK